MQREGAHEEQEGAPTSTAGPLTIQFEIAWRTFENHLKTTHADHMQNGALIRKLDNMNDGAPQPPPRTRDDDGAQRSRTTSRSRAGDRRCIKCVQLRCEARPRGHRGAAPCPRERPRDRRTTRPAAAPRARAPPARSRRCEARWPIAGALRWSARSSSQAGALGS